MTNIEIHGLRAIDATKKRKSVCGIFKDKPYAKKVKITTYFTKATDLEDSEEPFLRVFSTPEDYLPEIIQLLEPLGLRIERVRLET